MRESRAPAAADPINQDGVEFTEYPIYEAPDEFTDGAPTGNDWATTAKYAMCDDYEDTTGGGTGDAFYSNYPCTEIAVTTSGSSPVKHQFAATVRGFGCDNPSDPTNLADVMLARLVMFEFEDIACIDLEYDIGGQYKYTSGRNYLFAGSAFECECNIVNTCAPPSAPGI